MENTIVLLTEQDVERKETIVLVSPSNPTPVETVYLSNIDQTVAFPVETIFFYEGRGISTCHIIERVRRAVSEILLVPYYFMAGRLTFNPSTQRLELVCNNAGILFAGAESRLAIKDLCDVSLPNPSFKHLILRIDGFKSLNETPLFTIQVTRFKCGGFSIGFVTNHSIFDGRAAAEMFENLASICRGEDMGVGSLHIDRSCIRARDPPLIQYQHPEYTKLAETSFIASSFTSPDQCPQPPSLLSLSESQSYKLFSFTSSMVNLLKSKATVKCSSFEAIVAHLWRARSKAVFDDLSEMSSVLFAVDIRSKISPPLPQGFVGNAVITACATAKVVDLHERAFSFCVERVKEAIERVTNEYVMSVIDWLEVHKGVPSTLNGNFYVSAWWKLPFHELDFGHGKPLFGGPVVSGMDEFVLLLSDGSSMGSGGGINVWIVLDQEKMKRFTSHVYEF